MLRTAINDLFSQFFVIIGNSILLIRRIILIFADGIICRDAYLNLF